MITYVIILSSYFLAQCLVQSTAIPQPDKQHNLDHMVHANHLQNPTHDTAYDHQQFLGDQAKTFDQLLPEESRRRLG